MSESNDDKTVVLGGAAALAAPAAPAAPAPAREASSHNALPVGTRLGEFEVVGLVGEGGFGIVYLAHDHSLERKVALKEYMPSSLASRGTDASVAVRSERHRETFEVGRRSFVNEARLLAQFDHPALVKVYRFWEANGTAYMAMPFYDGITLRDALKARGAAPDEAWIRKILSPVMEALAIIHAENCFHRDIAPDNIMLLRDERPVLLDFGAARRVIGDMTQALTVILKPGYAPIEQYAEMPGMKQGAWTDIYALGAVVYFMITGKTPPPSVGRMMQDNYEPLAQLGAGRFSDAFLQGVDRCLAVKAEARPQSMAEMRDLLGFGGAAAAAFPPPASLPAGAPPAQGGAVAATVVLPTAPAAPPRSAAPASAPPAASAAGTPAAAAPARKTGLWVGVGAGVIAVAGLGAYLVSSLDKPAPPAPGASAPAEPPAASAAASAPAPVAQASVPTPVQPPAAEPLRWDDAWPALLAAAAPGHAVAIDKLKTPVRVGKEGLAFTLRSDHAGFAYLLLLDRGTGAVQLIYPNALDPDNRIAAGKPLKFPREAWTYDADPPAGNWELLALVSDSPRDFAHLGLVERDGILSAPLATVEAATGQHGAAALAGHLRCEDGGTACSSAYAVARAVVEEAEGVAGPAKPAARDIAAGDRPAKPEKPARVPGDAPKKAGESEEEYMRKLNQDLDKLLGGKQ